MKDKIKSGEQSEIQRIINSIKVHKRGGLWVYSTLLEWDITEVLKAKLKSTARDDQANVPEGDTDLLSDCIERLKSELTRQLEDSDVDLDPYFEQARDSLGLAAQQISDSRDGRDRLKAYGVDMPRPVDIDLESGVLAKLTYIGFADASGWSVDGLFLTPQSESFELDIESIGDDFETDDDYESSGLAYPIEIHRNRMCFVLDDDGTIFVSTKDNDRASTEDVRNDLIRLANRLFLPG